MKFLVTGGRGFIGSHFVEKCLQEGHSVIDIDSMTYASNEKLPWDNNPNYKHIKEDICDITHIPSVDILVNFAAESHVDNSIKTPLEFVNTNVYGTAVMLESAYNFWNECDRVQPLLKKIQVQFAIRFQTLLKHQ